MRLALQLELCLLRLLSSPAPGGGARSTCAGVQPESWPQGQTDKRTPFTAPPRLAVDEPDADVAAGVGSDERDEQAREPVWQHGDAPEFQCYAQTRPLVVVEFDRPASPTRSGALNRLYADADTPRVRQSNSTPKRARC